MVGTKLRGGVAGSAIVALLAAVANFKTWEEFIVWAASTTGGAILLWGIIEGVDAAWHRLDPKHGWAPYNLKFYGAHALAFAIPLGSYPIMVYFGWATWGVAGLVAAITGVYQLSQTIHWEQDETQETKATEKAVDEGALEIVPTTNP
jgi:hypothetical protein